MIYGRLLTFFYALLLVFSQQQVLLHPYQHKADWLQEGYQQPLEQGQHNLALQDSYDSKQAPGHGVNCAQCLALSGISSVISASSFVFHVLPHHTQHGILAEQSFAAAVDVPYQSPAPPTFA